jgi:hypothetical protein
MKPFPFRFITAAGLSLFLPLLFRYFGQSNDLLYALLAEQLPHQESMTSWCTHQTILGQLSDEYTADLP